MDGIAGVLRSFAGESGGSRGRGSDGGGQTQKRAGYIFTALVVPFIFSKVIKPVRIQLRLYLGKQYKRGLKRSGKNSNRAAACRFLLQHLDTVLSKEVLFSFYLALLVFLRTVIPHFKTVARGITRSMR